MNHLLPTATARDEADRAATVAVLPVGSFEQHGDYLPLATDAMIAFIIAKEVAKTYNLLLLPPITISCSHEHAGWAGTVSISAATLHAVVNDVAESLRASGVHRLLIVSGHGGNYVLANIVQEASIHEARMALFPTGEDWRKARLDASLTTGSHDDMHAGELETSILLHALPGIVRAGYEAADHQADHRPHLLTLGMRGYTTSGVIGSPSLGTAEKGKEILESLARSAQPHLGVLRYNQRE